MQTTTHSNLIVFPQSVQDWLTERTLTKETIEKFGLSWNGREIVIPVRDDAGVFLFNKYRRDPFTTDETIPKYRYEKGASSVLFNAETLNDATPDAPIFIVEGELDCMAVENIGIKAVTTTGGAGTFEEEWAKRLAAFSNVIICFDNDAAGIKGAIHVQSMIPHARILFLPPKEGKDVTDYLKTHANQEFLSLKAESFPIPLDCDDTRDKKMVRAKIREFKDACVLVQTRRREAIQARQGTAHLDIMVEYLSNRYALYQRAERNLSRVPYTGSGDKVIAAKQVPITNFVKFNRQGYAPCLWHSEKTASMFYNKENKSKFPNTVKCFGCGAMGDAVDVTMLIHNLDFTEAVKFLTNQ